VELNAMKYFKIKYLDGRVEIVKEKSMLSLIQKRKLYTEKHDVTNIYELSGEQGAIAISNED